MIVQGLLCVLVVSQVVHGQFAKPSSIKALTPSGIEFVIPDSPGTTLVAFHYSINRKLSGTAPGQYNVDVRSKNGGQWVHRNTQVQLNKGDTVYYWTYQIINGFGHLYKDQHWKAESSVVAPNPATGGSQGQVAKPQPQPRRARRVVFLDNFNSGAVDTNSWKYESSGWGGGNGEFQAYTPHKSTTYIKDGKLFILPKLARDVYDDNFIKYGTFDFKKMYGYCTQTSNSGCRKAAKYLPTMSGRIRTKGAWKYGKFTVRAKLPRGDWIWPAIWFLPQNWEYGGWPRSGEIDLVESRGNRAYGDIGVQRVGATLHWGLDGRNEWARTHGSVRSNSETYGASFHDYVLTWDAEGMKLDVDGKNMYTVRTGSGYCRRAGYSNCGKWTERAAPFNKEFYLILNVAVGGTGGFFPDGIVGNKPWRNSDGWNGAINFYNARHQWSPTWHGEDAAMQVEYVRIEQ